jgi:hypothetical protein
MDARVGETQGAWLRRAGMVGGGFMSGGIVTAALAAFASSSSSKQDVEVLRQLGVQVG